MKKTMRLFIVLLVGVLLFLAGSMVTAQAASTLIFDEYGVMFTYNASNPNGPYGGWYLKPGVVGNDPWLGVSSLHWDLTPPPGFTLPVGSVGYVDVPVWEEGSSSNYSDVMRFCQPQTDIIRLYYYSDPNNEGSEETGEIADISEAAWTTLIGSLNILTGTVIPQESNGQFFWHSPLTGSDYYGYSEGHATVPEPSTMLLLGSGLIGLVGYGRKKFFKK